MNKKKILFFLKVPPPVTGATLMNDRVVQSQYLQERFDISTIPVSYANSVSDIGSFRIKKGFLFINIYFKLLFELIFKKPDLVYFQISPLGKPFFRDCLFVFLIKAFRVDILYHLRAKGIKNEASSIWKRKLYSYIFKSEHVICLAKANTSDIEDVYSGEVYIVNNGIPDIDKSMYNVPCENCNKARILFLSNLLIEKGIIDFLDSLEIISEMGLSFVGIIIGAESDLSKNQLTEEIRNRNLSEQVSYLGPKYDEEKHKIISDSDIVVFPTKMNETFGNVNLEAMQHSKPIISTNIAAIPEIIDDGVNGFIVNPGSPSEIADRVKVLIVNHQKRIEFGKRGREKYEAKYTLKHFERRMAEVFNTVLNKKID